MVEKLNDKLQKDRNQLQNAVRERMTGYIFAALGLVAGLAWNDAIKTTIEYLFPLNKDGLWAKFLYAIIVTIIVVATVYFISKFFVKKAEDDAKK